MKDEDRPKIERVEPRGDGPVWPPEAKTVKEAQTFWERHGVTRQHLTVSAEEMEQLSPGYASRRAALKINDNRRDG